MQLFIFYNVLIHLIEFCKRAFIHICVCMCVCAYGNKMCKSDNIAPNWFTEMIILNYGTIVFYIITLMQYFCFVVYIILKMYPHPVLYHIQISFWGLIILLTLKQMKHLQEILHLLLFHV